MPPSLTDFLRALLDTGEVMVAGQLTPFAPDDLATATALLRRYHAADALHLAYQAPPFEPAAAQWAAECLYRTAQLAFLRDYDADAVATHLADYPGAASPAASYAVDLSFRHLPALLDLARNLAPADALVARLQALAQQWPLSFVGAPPAPADALVARLQALARQWPLSFVGAPPAPAEAPAAVLAHSALRALYLDRIIEQRDRARATQPGVAEGIRAALGECEAQLWADFPTFVFPAL